MCNKIAMEELKEKLEKLPESEKVRLLMELVMEQSQKHTNETCAENPGKKQKTLDSWLIKRNDSSHKNKNASEIENISTSAINNVPKHCSNSNNVSLNNMKDSDCTTSLHSIIPIGNDFSRVTSNKSEKNKDNSVNDLLIQPSKKKNLPEKYNLRSKRKFTTLSPVNQCNEYTAGYNKDNISNSSDSNKNLNFHKKAVGREIEKLESIKQSQITETSVKQHSSLSNNDAQIQNNSSYGEHMEDEYHNSSDVSSHSKTSYKLGTKRKKAFVKSRVDCSNVIIVHEDENEKLNSNSELTQSQKTEISDNQYCSSPSKIPYKLGNRRKKPFAESKIEGCSGIVAYEGLNNQSDALSQSNEQNTNVSQQSNYEAFCKLNTECSKIGINVMDILGDENIQNLLNDCEKLNNESVVCIGSFKSTLKKTLPVVHLIESKKKLLKCICELQKIQ